ncbi:hybrid sensor histidine kinase/response regulator [Carboxylicivirga marina]|uniref:histidine kinase n=1 Tax=Carboxylicivirga marina TaxID=2800988 RepID=A0ABS1HI44_9BACT|nr:histidine kinase [Carboxylicivirga marina]MBK3516874.1 response regulator [Carboxylicivirga marina]
MESLLIVDNDRDTYRLYELVFRGLYKLEYTNRFDEAVDIIKEKRIKIVIVEPLIQTSSITELLQELRLEFPLVKVILVSNIHDHLIIQEAINKYGIYSYFVKPIEPHRIQVATERAIEQYNLEIQQKKLINSLKKKTTCLKKVVKQLKYEEEKFRMMYETRPEPTFIISSKGEVRSYNPSALEMFPHLNNSSETDLFINYFKGERAEIIKNYLSSLIKGENNSCEIEWFINNEKVHFDISGFKLVYQDEESFLLTFRDVSLKKEMENRVLTSIINTEEKERRRFAQELHDGIGPLLSTTKLYLQWFNKPDSKANKSEIINKAEETLEETISSLREISNNISPNTLINFGLDTALKTFLDRIRNATSLKVNYHSVVRKRLKNELETTLYRLLCECVNNTIKHANADKIDIEILDDKDGLTAKYRDNGKGFDVVNMMRNGKGNGLLNMKSRVKSLGGFFELKSADGKGVEMNIKFNIT